MQPVVTVVIPTRNRFALLREALASVRAQTFVEWQIIVVDDASDDGSADRAAQSLTATTRSCSSIGGACERSTARNTGSRTPRHGTRLFLDDDDRLFPTALERLVAALDRKPDAAVGIGARRMFDERGHTRRAPHPRIPSNGDCGGERRRWAVASVAVPGQCMFRTQTLRDSGGWNATLVGPEDQELLLRRLAAGPTCAPAAAPGTRVSASRSQWRPPDVADQEAAFRTRSPLGQAATRTRGGTSAPVSFFGKPTAATTPGTTPS